jgi:hypothetical protein
MKAQINKSEVFKSAWKLAKEMAVSFAEALKKAWQFVKNQTKVAKAFLASFFEITFVKASTGEVTTRQASNPKIKENNLLFFSVSDNGFRSAIIDKIIEIKPIENVSLTLA